MHDPSPAAAVDAVADPTVPGRSLTFERRWTASTSEQHERTRLIEQARDADATARLRRCCPSAALALESLSWRALARLAANEPADLNDPDSWRSPDAHAQIVLRRHGITGLDSTRLTMEAVRAFDRWPGARRPEDRPPLGREPAVADHVPGERRVERRAPRDHQ